MTVVRTSKSSGPGSPEVTGFYDKPTGSVQYVVADPETKACALVDIVMGFDDRSAATDFKAAEEVLKFVSDNGYKVAWILDTHPHADHMLASHWLKEKLGVKNAIGEKVQEIAVLWRELYNCPNAFNPEQDFDKLFADGDTFSIGKLPVKVMLSPGHTLGSITYIVGRDAAFVHDTFMQPDAGTSRADFPGGSAHDLFQSLQKILALPDNTRLFIGHDYGTKERSEPAWESTVADQRESNIHIGGGVDEAAYVELREGRDKTLSLPERMLFALQVNLRAGRLPDAEDDGHRYLKIPLNRF